LKNQQGIYLVHPVHNISLSDLTFDITIASLRCSNTIQHTVQWRAPVSSHTFTSQ